MPLLKRKLTDTSFIISIESGVEEIPVEKHPTSTSEDCDFLVNFITGEESLSASFCCKLFYTIFRVCFTTDDGPKRPPRSTYRTI